MFGRKICNLLKNQELIFHFLKFIPRIKLSTYRCFYVHGQWLNGHLTGLVGGLIANHVHVYRVEVFGGLFPSQVDPRVWMAGEIHYFRSRRRHNVRALDHSVRVVAVVLPRVRLHVDLVLRVWTWKI